MSAVCYQHAEVTSVATCTHCVKPVCRACLVFEGSSELCLGCRETVRRAARGNKLAVWAVVGVVLAAAGATAGWVAMQPKPAPVALKTAEVIPPAPEPCDRTRIIKEGEAWNRAGEYRKAIEKSEAFFARCGEYPRLLWVTYTSHKYLSEFDNAAAAATKLIESDPDDKDYWWWRGIAYEGTQDWAKAAADYEQALKVQPKLKNIPFNLARAYERQGKPCEALAAIQRYLKQYPQSATEPEVKHRVERLRDEGKCRGPVGAGRR